MMLLLCVALIATTAADHDAAATKRFGSISTLNKMSLAQEERRADNDIDNNKDIDTIRIVGHSS